MDPPLFDTNAIRLFQVTFDDEMEETDTRSQRTPPAKAAAAAGETEPEEEPNPAAALDAQ